MPAIPAWIEQLPERLGSAGSGKRLRALLGPSPGPREIRVACNAAILVSLAILIFTTAIPGGFLGWRAGQDFAAFYDAGTILNRGLAPRLYDLNLQTSLYSEVNPAPGATSLYPNAPWFALLFRPFALLPFAWAYPLWVLASVALYLGGLALLWPALEPGARRSALLAALSFHPFVMETLLSGQVTAVAFFFLAAATRLLRRERSFLAGCFLSGCLYKPTMLLWIGPMLLLGRRWKALGGILAGALALAAVSLLCVGPSSLTGYWRMMTEYRTLTSSHQEAFLAWEKFIDGYHFFRLLPGGDSFVMTAFAAVCAVCLLALLVPAWLRCGRALPAFREVTWSATLTFTLVLNLHAQHYDAVLLVVAFLASAEVLSRQPDPVLRSAWFRMAVLIWALPWISQTLTRQLHLQVFTLAIVLLGLLQLATAWRVARFPKSELQRVNTTATSSL
jgi:hypothetical protein